MNNIEQYRKWLQEEIRVRTGATNMGAAMIGAGIEECLRKLNQMIPEPVAVSVQDAMTGMLIEHANEVGKQMDREWKEKHGDQQDDTDRLYPR